MAPGGGGGCQIAIGVGIAALIVLTDGLAAPEVGEGLISLELEYPGTAITEEGLQTITAHLESLDALSETEPYNNAMLEKLESMMANGEDATGAYQNFYQHELQEAANMTEGMDPATAHQAALEAYGHNPYSIYPAEIVQQFAAYFNSNWFLFWGL